MVDTSQSFVSRNEHLLARREQLLRYAGRYVREIHVYRLHDSKIREHGVEMATMELLQQIGALRSRPRRSPLEPVAEGLRYWVGARLWVTPKRCPLV